MDIFSSPLLPDLNLECATLFSLCEAINSPRSLAVALLIGNGEWEQYLDLPWDHSIPRTVSNFADDYLVSEFLRKSPNLPLAVDKTAVATASFFVNEEKCRLTNRRFAQGGVKNHHEHFLAVRREVATILGPLTDADLGFVERSFGFGPGANVGVRGTGMVSSDKFDNDITLTRNLIPFYKAILGELWWKHQDRPQVVLGNRFTTVPKDARKDRGICVEPMLNNYVQTGIGAALRRRLSISGLDLNSQDRNRNLSSRAYREDLATIDLEAASDTVSYAVVRELLPPRWFELLCIARSNFTRVKGIDVELEKFSSMGNGYTFELESLLFWSCVRAIVPIKERHLCSVFGDDIICPQRYSQALIGILEYFGFKVNGSKSFLAGRFFESCGTDWYEGTNVRPIYAKGSRDLIPYSLQLANKLRMYSYMRNFGESCDNRFQPAHAELVRKTHAPWRNCRVPPDFGDVGIISDISEARTRPIEQAWFEGARVKTVQVRPKTICKDTLGRHLIALRSIGQADRQDFVIKRAINCTLFTLVLPATYGKEPRRGFLRKPMTKWSVFHKWTKGLLWAPPLG